MEKTTETTLADLDLYTAEYIDLKLHIRPTLKRLIDAPIPEILRDMADICDWRAKRYQEIAGYEKDDADYQFVSKELYPVLQNYVARWIGSDGFKRGVL